MMPKCPMCKELLVAAKMAVNHLEACQIGAIHRPFKSASLPKLRDAIAKVEAYHKQLDLPMGV